eukprot:TRINITY_DN1049_c0_g1_i1.p1 TRINITY_DN1049_c0_g1~~TRINITY_DN1049_c0_g1_i1.p1  ORF type:complete len:289 (-),score=103.74 TRINITY_DN1049_c0_g1_i1:83-949(-)
MADLGVVSPRAQGVKSFTESLDKEALDFFNKVTDLPFSQQAVHFLNAYWHEVKQDAEFIYSVSWEKIKYADMHSKGISLIFKYEEGNSLDFDIGLYFYEILCKFLEDPKNAEWTKATMSQPEMMTAIKRKVELRDNVDVNFDGRVSFLEYLLYQYKAVANPADFCKRSMNHDEHPEVQKARLALEDVNKRIKDFEEEKHRLQQEADGTGVKALGAKNMLAQLENNPLKDLLNKALITAEAAVRLAVKKFGGAAAPVGSGSSGASSEGALWWMQRDLEDKKKRYGKKDK